MLRSPMAALWRNREFVLLQLGQLLSSAGTSSTTIAYPLLALSLTHSPAKAGIISFARLIPYGLFGLLAGLAADRWNRKRLMIAAGAVRAAAVGALAGAILVGWGEFWRSRSWRSSREPGRRSLRSRRPAPSERSCRAVRSPPPSEHSALVRRLSISPDRRLAALSSASAGQSRSPLTWSPTSPLSSPSFGCEHRFRSRAG